MPLAILTVPRHSLIAAFLVGLSCAPAVALAPSAQPAKSAAARQAELVQNYGKLPISFEANRGQTDPSVQFLSRGSGYSLYLTNSSAVLSLSKAASSGKDCHPEQTGAPADGLSPLGTESEGSGSHPPRQTQSVRPCDPAPDSIRMELSGANPQAKVAGTDQLPGIANYFLGKDPARWHTNIPTYAKVRYTGVYPGIDLVYYGNQRQLEYDFIVAPNANPNTIQLHFAGAQKISLTPTGDLTIQSKNGQIAFRKPEIYQEVSGKRLAVAGSFVLTARNDVSFHIGQYDKTRPLTIDPVVAYSTYFGLPDANSDGSSTDVVDAVAMDASGSAYIAGYVESGQYSTGAAFVSKLNASGSAVLYSTYLSNVTPVAIAVDNAGRAYITGAVPNSSEFANFPVTQGAFQTVATSKYPVAFVAAIDATGSNLIYASFLGGAGSATYGGDQGTGIAVDGAGDAYVTGITASSNFPVTSGAFQKVNNTVNSQNVGNAFPNAFVTKVNPAGTALVYSTYLGGNHNDGAVAIAIDGQGSAYVTGYTYSATFPLTKGAFQTTNSGYLQYGTSFVTKLNPAGSALDYSTFLGGNTAGDFTTAIAVDSNGNAYLTGGANSTNFPVTAGSYQLTDNEVCAPKNDPTDFQQPTGFVSKLNATGTGLVYSTYLGGSSPNGDGANYCENTGGDYPLSIGIDGSGNAYIAGYTSSTSYPLTSNPLFTFLAGRKGLIGEGFLTELNPAGSSLTYSTYLGSVDSEPQSGGEYLNEDSPSGPKIAVSSGGTVLVTGTTVALDFLTSSDSVEPHSPDFQAGSNGPGFPIPYGFVMMLNPGEINDGAATATTLTSSNLTQVLGVPVTFTAQVSSVGSNVVPTGSVDFWGTNSSDEPFSSQPYYLGTGTLNSSGKASITTPNESFNGVILANYSGSSDSVFSAGIVNQSYSNPGLKYLSGSNQATVYGKPFPNPITVQTTNAAGQAVDAAGIPVLFSGSGVSVPNPGVSVNTNSNGTVGVIATPTRAGNLTATASYGSAAMVTFNLLAEKAPLYISARNIAVTYGQTPPQPTAYLLTGFVNGDTASVVSGAPILTTTVTSATPVGVYPIGVQVGTLSAANYYFDNFSSGEGAVYVGRAPLHLSAKNVAITYGQNPPAITGYTLTGFVNGESSSVVSGAPVLTTTVTATTPPGTYPIGVQIGTLSAANYIFETTSSGEGSIQVAKAPLTILPASVTIHVGDPLPTFTYAITGFVNGDTQATATTGAPTLTTTAPNTNTPGHYYIVATAGSLAAKNYTFNAPSTATDGILTILPN